MVKALKKIKQPARKRPLGGRPTAYKPEYVGIAAKCATVGMTYAETADLLGVTDRTFYNWMTQHPELRKAISIAMQDANERVQLSLFQQAVGYERNEEDIKVINGEIVRVPVKRYYPPSGAVAVAWARQHMGWGMEAPPPPPKDDGAEVEGMQISIRQVARRVAYLLHQNAKGNA